jgi:glutamate---cysteine ligase / carboxylate-amine ligase
VPLGLFDGYGVEIEWMIVDRETLDVRPLADALLRTPEGAVESEIERGDVAWSNELAAHVIELKTNGPAPSLEGLAARFTAEAREIDARLEPLGARLLPTAMHPWMDPEREFVVWPHEYGIVYRTFDRIFGCHGHGWANVQSVHLNLPFANDEELGRLHEAIRLVLPIVPAIAASSPFVEGRATGLLDNRLAFYRKHVERVPAMIGHVVPEPVFTRADYEQRILGGIYRAMEPLDREGVLRHEWANARGAIVRFDRMAIEIRLLDVQETPVADLAIAKLVSAVIEDLVHGRRGRIEPAHALAPERLAAILERTIVGGERASIGDAAFLEAIGISAAVRTAGEAWRALAASIPSGEWTAPAATILEHGPLARRILDAAGAEPDRARLAAVYRDLAGTLSSGELFLA